MNELQYSTRIRADKPLEPQIAKLMSEYKSVKSCVHKWSEWHTVNGYTWRTCESCKVKEVAK